MAIVKDAAEMAVRETIDRLHRWHLLVPPPSREDAAAAPRPDSFRVLGIPGTPPQLH
jgi:hypothetical protein